MKWIIPLLLVLPCWTWLPVFGQVATPADTIQLSRAGAEQLFLSNNLLLIAEKLNIQQAEALVMQARLWPNPSLSIDEVNLWATDRQLAMGEELPPLTGSRFGKNRQISAELEQVILTARKRKKLVAMEEVSRDMAAQYFEDLLRNLKIEFRNNLTQLQYLQLYQQVYARQMEETSRLLAAYEQQVIRGNINRAELIRLKALLLELRNDHKEIREEVNTLQQQLAVLLHLPAESYIVLEDGGFLPEYSPLNGTTVSELLQQAQNYRPDLQAAQLEHTYYERMHAYERAQRVPDLSLKAGYDRGGNFLYNFIGFGVGLDLPIFNRNQGQIRYAQLGIEKSRLQQSHTQRTVETEVMAAYRNLLNSISFYEGIEADYDAELDRLLDSYTRNFRSRNISMLEFLDFFEAYLDNKRTILNAQRELNINLEELRYVVGTEIE
ncbi:TolC family protein [Cesiribacter sp. SM1]|uniref:TolC family protein n=1 Tax=Cesiribacter sp. SM1 TaxID=2861196 RepID=UPI001CD4835C|nr:TolC family protein [Cesiribacter sp. SM1]